MKNKIHKIEEFSKKQIKMIPFKEIEKNGTIQIIENIILILITLTNELKYIKNQEQV